jgi:hypothetical protein
MHKHFISSASIRLSALLTLTEDYSGLNMMGLPENNGEMFVPEV